MVPTSANVVFELLYSAEVALQALLMQADKGERHLQSQQSSR